VRPRGSRSGPPASRAAAAPRAPTHFPRFARFARRPAGSRRSLLPGAYRPLSTAREGPGPGLPAPARTPALPRSGHKPTGPDTPSCPNPVNAEMAVSRYSTPLSSVPTTVRITWTPATTVVRIAVSIFRVSPVDPGPKPRASPGNASGRNLQYLYQYRKLSHTVRARVATSGRWLRRSGQELVARPQDDHLADELRHQQILALVRVGVGEDEICRRDHAEQ
jgi:hypothetical protein